MELLDALTSPRRGRLHHWAGGNFETAGWAEVAADARRIAVGLRRAGVGPGTRVPTVLTNTRSVASGVLGVWLAGGTLASLPAPARAMSVHEYADQLHELCESLEAPLFVLEDKMMQLMPEDLLERLPHRSWEELMVDGSCEFSPPGDDDVAFIQFSSGSTSMPKGCMLTTRAIASQLEILAEMVEAVPGRETVASWVPLSHDMGAFGCLLYSWAWGFDLALSSPQRFMYDPRSWFADCAELGATLSAGTPSALQVAARAVEARGLPGPLALRSCVIGAETISYRTLEKATEALAPYGLEARVWMPAYGLAEATLAVSAPGLDEDPSALHLDSALLAEGQIAPVADDDRATAVVSVGRALDGVSVRLADPARLSEIRVRSSSLFSGYYGNETLTRQRLQDGELATGDLGFEHDGRLYIVGRSDDLLSIAGRNVYAREIEAAVDLLEPVRSGCSTIVDVSDDGRRRLVLLVELHDPAKADCAGLAREAARSAKRKAGVMLDECVFLPKGALPKTPSGKIQRFRCRHLVASGMLEPVARVPLKRRFRMARRDRAAEAV